MISNRNSLDQLTEVVMLRRIVRIDAEQELLIVSIEKGLSAQGGCMWLDSQTLPEVIHVSPAELSDQLALVGQLAIRDPGWAETRVAEAQSCGSTHGKVVVNPSSGRTESRLCLRVA
jgi:hypothetical protein